MVQKVAACKPFNVEYCIEICLSTSSSCNATERNSCNSSRWKRVSSYLGSDGHGSGCRIVCVRACACVCVCVHVRVGGGEGRGG